MKKIFKITFFVFFLQSIFCNQIFCSEESDEPFVMDILIAGTKDQPYIYQVEISGEKQLHKYLWLRGGLAGIFDSNKPDLFGGLTLGFRLHGKAFFAPFLGIGSYFGKSTHYKDADDDGVNNDDDAWTDEPGEKKRVDNYLSAIYPEIGMQINIAKEKRISAFGRYYVSTEGRDDDSWLWGLSFSVKFGSDSEDGKD
ncbi:MAG: hypothetical protein KJ915_07310 [Candidatus Omnitrophica bacterium]|nr:hypothetical protein [Candidatus Omnitrophota bacterium]